VTGNSTALVAVGGTGGGATETTVDDVVDVGDAVEEGMEDGEMDVVVELGEVVVGEDVDVGVGTLVVVARLVEDDGDDVDVVDVVAGEVDVVD